MIIRAANTSDIESILEIVNDARMLITSLGFKQWTIESNYPNYETFQHDILRQSLYVLESNNKVLGMVAICVGQDENYNTIDGNWISNNSNYLTIHRLAIKREFYGNGLAQRLIDFSLNKAKILNISSIRIDTHPLNIPMNNLIKKSGFTYCGKIMIIDDQIDPIRNAYEKVI